MRCNSQDLGLMAEGGGRNKHREWWWVWSREGLLPARVKGEHAGTLARIYTCKGESRFPERRNSTKNAMKAEEVSFG